MPARLQAVLKRVGATIAGFSFAQKTVSVLALLVLALGVTGLSVWLSQPQYVPLFSGISASDASAITTQLHTDNVPYQLTDGGATILVPQAQVYQERLKAASANGWLDERTCAMEALIAFKRAGADAILTYYALTAAAWLKEKS